LSEKSKHDTTIASSNLVSVQTISFSQLHLKCLTIFVCICSYCSYIFIYTRHWRLFHHWSSLTHGCVDGFTWCFFL